MSASDPALSERATQPPKPQSTFIRILKYGGIRAATLLVTLVISLYLTILVASSGGYIDKVYSSGIESELANFTQSGGLRGIVPEEQPEILWQMRWWRQEEYGLHQPFFERSLKWLWDALTLNYQRQAIQSAASYTLLLVGTSDLLLFLCIPLALILSRQQGKFLGKLSAIFASLFSAPSWIQGILLIYLFVTLWGILPYPRDLGTVGMSWGANALILLKQMIMPVIAIFLSMFFQLLYTWRIFFTIYSEEDYVNLAQAKGLPTRMIDRKYILRPTLPYIVTNFLMLTIGMWTNIIALEVLFKWPGLGSMVITAVTGLTSGLLTMGLLSAVGYIAYLLAATVFVLDFLYAVLDPRVRIGGQDTRGRVLKRKLKPFQGIKVRTRQALPVRVEQPVAREEPAPAAKVRRARGPRLYLRLDGSENLRSILRQPSGVIGALMILILIGISLYVVATTPAGEAITAWHPRTALRINPENALPEWVNLFRREKLPSTIMLNSTEASVQRTETLTSSDQREVVLTFPFDYPYDGFPQEISLDLNGKFESKAPMVFLTWITPDGNKVDLGNQTITSSTSFNLSQDEKLRRRLGEHTVLQKLFTDPASTGTTALRGQYQLQVRAMLFEPEADLEANLVVHGQVFGWAGTDQNRRDLLIPMMQGLPVALTFGILGALATSFLSMLIAAAGVWFGGWFDELVQRICEINMTLPAVAVIMLTFLFISKSIWAVLGVLVLLNIFGSPLKNYRAALLPMKEASYIEAALAQGASSLRIISRYLVPHILPLMITQLIISVPVFVYYEATLSFLGVSDAAFPTWGRVIYDVINSRDFMWYPHRFLIPLSLIVVTGLGFALLGIALERVMNPRLRER
jgi:peptide/nickel transport system permease protein